MSGTGADRHEIALGTVLREAYRVEAVLGRGGFATVYRATSLASGELVALKVLSRPALERAGGLGRFHREIELVSRLRHPNTVRVLGAGEDRRGWLFIAFELLVGRAVDVALAQEGAMQPARASAIVCEALAALEEAHSIGLVHRDIKPANLFLAGSPAGERVKVLDFGVAKSTRPETLEGLTRPGSTLGTPLYMAPEQIKAEPVTARSDLFALGIVLAEMVHGKDLYEGTPPIQLMTDRILGKAVPIPPKLAGDPLHAIVTRAVQLDPARRFGSAAEMRAALEAALPFLRTGRRVAGISMAMESTAFAMESTAFGRADRGFTVESTAFARPPPSFAEESTAFATVRPSAPEAAPPPIGDCAVHPVRVAARRARWALVALGGFILAAIIGGALCLPRGGQSRRLTGHHAPLLPRPSMTARVLSTPPSSVPAPPAIVDYFDDPRPLVAVLRHGLPARASIHQLVVYPRSANVTTEDPSERGRVDVYAAEGAAVRKLYRSTDNETGAFPLDDEHFAVIPRVVRDAKARAPRGSGRVLYVNVFCETCIPSRPVSVAMGGDDGVARTLVFYSLEGHFLEVKSAGL